MVEEKLKDEKGALALVKNRRDDESGQMIEKKNVERGNSPAALGGSMDFRVV